MSFNLKRDVWLLPANEVGKRGARAHRSEKNISRDLKPLLSGLSFRSECAREHTTFISGPLRSVTNSFIALSRQSETSLSLSIWAVEHYLRGCKIALVQSKTDHRSILRSDTLQNRIRSFWPSSSSISHPYNKRTSRPKACLWCGAPLYWRHIGKVDEMLAFSVSVGFRLQNWLEQKLRMHKTRDAQVRF